MAAIKKTMAANHLSEGAQKRAAITGDTEMYETKYVRPGSKWHVNPEEKSLMEMYGERGENIVEEVGSGTINPETGLEEKQLTAAIGVGLSVYSAFKGGSEQASQAGQERRIGQEGINALSMTEEQANKSRDAQKASAIQDHSMALEKFSAEHGVKKEDLEQQTATAIQQSGLATSGTIQQKRSTVWGRIQSSFGRGREGLMASLGKRMGEIEGWFEGEVARIGSEKQKFERMIAFAKEKEGAWYLGKNVKEAGKKLGF